MDSFSESKAWNRVKAGFKGGPFFKNPMTPQKMTFVDGFTSEQTAKIQMSGKAPSMSITDTWNNRRSK